jgi:hypothetical protein
VAKQLRAEANRSAGAVNKVELPKEIKQAFEGSCRSWPMSSAGRNTRTSASQGFAGLQVFKPGRSGGPAWTTNGFEDRDGEIFETKAIEEYVARHENDAVKGDFRFWHIPGSKFGTIQWQASSGRFLAEAGPFDDSGTRRSRILQ